MQTVLIAEKSEILAEALAEELRREYTVHTCCRGDTAAALLAELRPDILIIDLMLPYVDGLTILREAVYTPPCILALSNLLPDIVLQAAWDAGVGFAMLIPCSCRAVAARLKEMLRADTEAHSRRDPQAEVRKHLDRLGIPATRSGYKRLQVGVPLYAQDPEQSLHKELYPAIASLCGNENWQQVESAMRVAIHKTWQVRDARVWEEYFPGLQNAPSNWKFLDTLAKRIQEDPSPDQPGEGS